MLFKGRKNINLILVFVFLLVLGAGWAKIEERKQRIQILAKLEIAQEKINEANAFLILNQEQKANELFLQALEQIEPFFIAKIVLEQEVSQMKNKIEAQLFDSCRGLFEVVDVDGEAHTDVPLAVGAESDAGSRDDVGLLQKHCGKVGRGRPLGAPDPDVERGGRSADPEARLLEAVDKRVAPRQIHLSQLVNLRTVVALDGDNARPLGCREEAVVHIRLQLRQCVYDIGVADGPADAPAGHIEGL